MKVGVLLFAITIVVYSADSLSQSIPMNAQVRAFIDEMVKKHDFDEGELTELLREAHFRQDIIDAISRPAEAKPWFEYRPIFVTDSRARDGIAFWEANEQSLRRAEERYGVPPEIIVAIIGVETRYGAHMGRYRVLDALSTLAFGYPKRSRFFRKELEEFLVMTREEDIKPTDLVGSYAGALGKPQFIPSSFRAYAVDFDNDGTRNLWDSNADAIGSVASYFVRHGWKPGQRVTTEVRGAQASHQKFVDAGMKPSIRLKTLYASGITASGINKGAKQEPDALASLIKLETENSHEYWLGFNNFYVITRYNHSNLYAMAVFQLSQEILALKNAREVDPVSF